MQAVTAALEWRVRARPPLSVKELQPSSNETRAVCGKLGTYYCIRSWKRVLSAVRRRLHYGNTLLGIQGRLEWHNNLLRGKRNLLQSRCEFGFRNLLGSSTTCVNISLSSKNVSKKYLLACTSHTAIITRPP